MSDKFLYCAQAFVFIIKVVFSNWHECHKLVFWHNYVFKTLIVQNTKNSIKTVHVSFFRKGFSFLQYQNKKSNRTWRDELKGNLNVNWLFYVRTIWHMGAVVRKTYNWKRTELRIAVLSAQEQRTCSRTVGPKNNKKEKK